MARSLLLDHPERERIELELALSPSVREVADRYRIPRRTLARHRNERMTAEQIARLRGMTPPQVAVDIEELARRGGEAAVIGFSRLILECKDQAEQCDKLALPSEAVKFRKLQLEAYKEQAKIAALYPGKRNVTNNNLVVGDMSVLFDLVDAALKPFPEARVAVASVFAQAPESRAALEHAA